MTALLVIGGLVIVALGVAGVWLMERAAVEPAARASGEAPDPALDVALDLTAEGAGGDGERDLHTHQAVFVEGDRGWYQPGNEASIEVRTLTPNNEPVTTKGEVSIRRISYDNGGQAREDA